MSDVAEFVASRVSVFDAATLDKEINGFLKKQIHNVIADLPSGGIEKIGPEIEAALKVALWLLSVERNQATFGQQLLRLKYRHDATPNKLRLLGAALIGYSYLKSRSQHLDAFKDRMPPWIAFCLKHFEIAVTALNVLSFLKFLQRGGSPLFVENILGIRPISTARPSERSIGYSFMTRALLWHGAIELCCLVLPHINVPKIGRIVRNTLLGKPVVSPTSKQLIFSNQVKCSICRHNPIIPHILGCDHFFCYFCISSSLQADPKFECPDCGYSNPEGRASRWVPK